MKRLLLSLMVLGLMGLSVAVAPTVYSVVITPLYGNIGSTLTCNYISSNASASAKYRFYDNGVWYNSATASYSTALVSGRSYNCSVNLTGGGASTGWKNSSTLAVIGDYCVNPYPLLFKNTRGNLNLTSFFSSYPVNIKVYGGDYKLFTNHNRVIENKTIIFIGGDYGVSGALTRDVWMFDDALLGKDFTGTLASSGQITDNNDATYFEKTGVSAAIVYGDMPFTTTLNTVIHFYGYVGVGVTGSVTITVQANNSGGWDTLATVTRSSAGTATSHADIVLAEAYQNFRISYITSAAVTTPVGRFYDLSVTNYSSGAISGAYSIPASFTPDNFSGSGYLYGYNYHDEEAGTAFSFSDAGDLNDSRIEVGCASASTAVINITDDTVGQTYMIGSTEDLRQIKTFLEYDDTSELFRVNAPVCTSSQYQATDQYLPDAGTYTVRAYTFNLDDQTADKRYEDGWLKVKRSIGGGLGSQILHVQDWGGTKSVLTYLIDNREYIVSLVADDCSENALGYVTSNPAVTTFSLSASGSTVNTTYFNDAYENFRYFFDYAPPSTRINFTYNDSDGAVDWVWWGVYDTDNGTLMYSDNSTAHNYKGSYVVTNTSRRYYGAVIFRRNNQTISDIVEGGLTRQEDYLDDLDYTGEILGLEYPTLFMLISLAVISMTALLVSPASVGVGLMMGWAETLFFSVIGWLPLISSGVGSGDWTSQAGWIVLTLGFIICAMVMYTEKR